MLLYCFFGFFFGFLFYGKDYLTVQPSAVARIYEIHEREASLVCKSGYAGLRLSQQCRESILHTRRPGSLAENSGSRLTHIRETVDVLLAQQSVASVRVDCLQYRDNLLNQIRKRNLIDLAHLDEFSDELAVAAPELLTLLRLDEGSVALRTRIGSRCDLGKDRRVVAEEIDHHSPEMRKFVGEFMNETSVERTETRLRRRFLEYVLH